jgi:hypothetical protein
MQKYDEHSYRRAALDDPPAHDPNVVDGSAADNDPAREVPALRPGARKLPAGKRCSRLSPHSGLQRLTRPRARLRLPRPFYLVSR